jgi:carboxymethylenebutenolidase
MDFPEVGKTKRWFWPLGSADRGIPMDDVQAMKDALAKAGSTSQILVYDGAPHAFHADYRPTFRKEGWARLPG